jgi:hypothetical protein
MWELTDLSASIRSLFLHVKVVNLHAICLVLIFIKLDDKNRTISDWKFIEF